MAKNRAQTKNTAMPTNQSMARLWKKHVENLGDPRFFEVIEQLFRTGRFSKTRIAFIASHLPVSDRRRFSDDVMDFASCHSFSLQDSEFFYDGDVRVFGIPVVGDRGKATEILSDDMFGSVVKSLRQTGFVADNGSIMMYPAFFDASILREADPQDLWDIASAFVPSIFDHTRREAIADFNTLMQRKFGRFLIGAEGMSSEDTHAVILGVRLLALQDDNQLNWDAFNINPSYFMRAENTKLQAILPASDDVLLEELEAGILRCNKEENQLFERWRTQMQTLALPEGVLVDVPKRWPYLPGALASAIFAHSMDAVHVDRDLIEDCSVWLDEKKQILKGVVTDDEGNVGTFSMPMYCAMSGEFPWIDQLGFDVFFMEEEDHLLELMAPTNSNG